MGEEATESCKAKGRGEEGPAMSKWWKRKQQTLRVVKQGEGGGACHEQMVGEEATESCKARGGGRRGLPNNNKHRFEVIIVIIILLLQQPTAKQPHNQ